MDIRSVSSISDVGDCWRSHNSFEVERVAAVVNSGVHGSTSA